MTQLILDTHAAVNELVSAGMPERQAETVVRQQARLLEQNLATKADIEAIKAGIETCGRKPRPASKPCGRKPRPTSKPCARKPRSASKPCARKPRPASKPCAREPRLTSKPCGREPRPASKPSRPASKLAAGNQGRHRSHQGRHRNLAAGNQGRHRNHQGQHRNLASGNYGRHRNHQGQHRNLASGNYGPHRSREGGSHQVDLWPQPRDGESDRRPHQAVVTTGRPAGLRTSVLTFCPTSAPSRAVFLLLSVIPDPDRGSSAFSFSFVRKATDTGFSITIVEDDRKGT